MRERARLLKFGPRDPSWLDGLESEMAETGIAMATARAQVVDRLDAALGERGRLGAFPSAQLALAGTTDAMVAEGGTVDALRREFAVQRMRDAETGRTNFGPHLTDLSVRHTEKRAEARECSTGEQKALLISIVLADAWELMRARSGTPPLLLLDEVAAHLDVIRRNSLFEEIVALGAQAWMTGTDLALFDNLAPHADILSVADGRILRQE